MKKAWWGPISLILLLVLTACGTTVAPQAPVTGNGLSLQPLVLPTATPTPVLSIPSQQPTPTLTPTPVPTRGQGTPPPSANCVTYSSSTTRAPAKNGGLAAPYGSPPTQAEAQTLTTQLFQLINQDRAACGLPPFAWNDTLAAGARLHSWNMIHCGFSHTCPDGSSPCQRIANEGYPNQSDCGENIGQAGPYPTPWGGVSKIQESMAQEPLGGWHRIHLFSTTLHSIGIGVCIDSNGFIWFTEDMIS